MGYMGAVGFAEQVKEGSVSLESALHWHLTANHYPPHPAIIVPVAMRAIRKAEKGQRNSRVRLPKNVEFRGRRTALVGDIIEALHLGPFIREED